MTYEIEDGATLPQRRNGSRINRFREPLSEMKVGQSFRIPLVSRAHKTRDNGTKLVASPEVGFNVKAANTEYAPKVFKKKRVYKGDPIGSTGKVEPDDAVRIFRMA